MAVKVGKQVIDKGEANGGRITLAEVRDVFEHSLSKKFRPMITDDEREFQKHCDKYGMSKEQAQGLSDFANALTSLKVNAKGLFIYVPKDKFNNPSVVLGSDIGHEVFHTLSKGKSVEGKKTLKDLQKRMKKEIRLEPGTNPTSQDTDIQSLLMNAFKINDLATPTPELCDLYSHLQTENRCLAYTRTVLRTVFDPRLKKGEQKVISELNLPIEKSINPNSIATRPTNYTMNFLHAKLKEEANAYLVSSTLDRYGYKLPPEAMPIKQLIAATFGRARELLKGEMAILEKNP